MKTYLLTSALLLLSFICYSQFSYEKGYLINSNEERVECLIKNLDWKNNPSHFSYKLSADSEEQQASISEVKEFRVYGYRKYIRAQVQIDRSSIIIEDLSKTKMPEFKNEELFLKVLVEGEANLYHYEDGSLNRFFYSKEGSEIKQLVYKQYIKEVSKIATNDYYKTQLYAYLRCDGIPDKAYENLTYKRKPLTSFFINYNQCKSPDAIVYEDIKPNRSLFNLSLRPGVSFSNLNIEHGLYGWRSVDFDSETNFRFGVEAEFVLPFNKGKWAVLIEPSYQHYKSTKSNYHPYTAGNVLNNHMDYNSFDLPFGLRHYLFLNDKSKLYFNAAYKFSFPIYSSFTFTREDGSEFFSPLDFAQVRANFVLGFGYKFADKVSLEMQYHTPNQVLDSYSYWYSELNTVSVVFGYTIF